MYIVAFCIFTLFLTNLLALALGGFALANSVSMGMPTESSSDGETVAQMQLEIAELRRNLSALRVLHSMRIEDLRSQLELLQQNHTDASAPTISTTLPGVTAPPTVIMPYGNCTTRQVSCIMNGQTLLGDNHGLPMFGLCITPPISVVSNDKHFVADVFCSIDEGQNMPVSSALLFTSSEYSCMCTAIQIPNLVQDTLASFECRLHITICPAQIRFSGY